MERQSAAAGIVAAYWDGWHTVFPALHKRGHWHIVHHLCTAAPAGAPLGELIGLTRQALLVDDATVRDRVQELLAEGLCLATPTSALSARTILAPAAGLPAAYDATLLTLRNAVARAASALRPGLAVPPAATLSPADRTLAGDALAALVTAWSALLDMLCDLAALSPARRLEVRRHLLSTSHRTLMLLAMQRHDAPSADAVAGLQADRMAAILLDRTGQNFQTTRDHLAALLALGALERCAGRALSVRLSAAAVPAMRAAMATLADRLAALMQQAAAPRPGDYALHIQTPGEPVRLVPIASFPFTIGRTDDNDLRLAAADISRAHCRIEQAGTDVLIADLASTNGTELDGRPVLAPTRLQDGAVIGLGPFQLTFLAPGETTDATLRQRRPTKGLPVI